MSFFVVKVGLGRTAVRTQGFLLRSKSAAARRPAVRRTNPQCHGGAKPRSIPLISTKKTGRPQGCPVFSYTKNFGRLFPKVIREDGCFFCSRNFFSKIYMKSCKPFCALVHLISRTQESEGIVMYPEPDFYYEYRSLIEALRWTPEAATAQLNQILDRFYTDDKQNRRVNVRSDQSGGVPS